MDAIKIKNNEVVSTNLPNGFTFNNHIITIDKNKQYTEPIKITLQDDNNEHLVINVGQSTEVKLILELHSSDKDKNNYDFVLNTGANSKVEYLVVADLMSNDCLLNHTFNVAKDSHLDLLGGFVSNVLNSKMHVKLNGEGGSVDIKAIAISSDYHFQNIDVLIEHFAPNTYGEMTNVGVVNKHGQIILNGIEKIHKGMKGVSAFQTLKGITTSDDAKLEVNPVLLIDEHDIKAGHGATIGKLQDEMLFYLMSRGITRAESEKLVIMGFLQPVINQIKDIPLQERFIELVNLRI